MPLAAVAVPAIISGGVKLYNASQDRKAAGKAAKAQNAAQERQLQLQREQFDRVQQLNQPFIQGGYAAFDQLLTRIGVQGAGQPQVRPPSYVPGAEAAARRAADGVGGGIGVQGSGPAYSAAGQVAGAIQPTGAQGGPDWQAYLDANPDVAANAAQRAQAEGIDPLTVAQQHWENFGQPEGRTLPQAGQVPQQAPTAPENITADPNAPPDYMNMARPDAPEAPTFQRPQDMQFRDYGDGPQFSWDPSQIAKDPGFLFETAETTKGVNAGAAARGKLRSGDAAKALQDRLFGVAHTYGNNYFNRALQGYNANRSAFQDSRNFGTGLTQWQQGRSDGIFADDRAYNTARWQDQRTYGDARFDAERNYQTNRYDNQTNNLFRVTDIGTGAAGNVSGAGSNYANNAGNVFGAQAQTASDLAAARAGANSQMVGAIGGTVGNIFANWGGGARTTPSNPQTLSSAWGFQSPHNPTFVNTPSSLRVF